MQHQCQFSGDKTCKGLKVGRNKSVQGNRIPKDDPSVLRRHERPRGEAEGHEQPDRQEVDQDHDQSHQAQAEVSGVA